MYLIVKSNALQRNSLQKHRQKSGIDCNVTAFVSGLRFTLSKTAVQRNPLQKFKIPTFGTVMYYELGYRHNCIYARPFWSNTILITGDSSFFLAKIDHA